MGVLQDAALDRAVHDADFFGSIEAGRAKMRLNRFLAPDDMTPETMTKAISLEINLIREDAERLLETLQANFRRLGAFQLEALGRVARDDASGYLVSLDADFFDPVGEFPQRTDY